jgi:U3 small nucleolar ribonucleoprotein protein IMP4
MLRRQARLRREYLYRKTAELKHKSLHDKKERIKKNLEEHTTIHTDLRKDALELHDKLKWTDEGSSKAAHAGGLSGGANTANSQDDEYRWAGCLDPKILITTSHNPSSSLKRFVKEFRLLIPNAQRINRGNYDIKQLVHASRANDATDLIIIHETRGIPTNLVICHLPHGPTAKFNISDIVSRHDIPDIAPMPEAKPHLIFHNFKTKLGERTMSILKYLFPVPKEDSKRVITFANHDDHISFRHHSYRFVDSSLELVELGPRFQLKLYQILLGTIDEEKAADIEWVHRPYMNTSSKRRFLSDEDGWQEDAVE